MTTYVGSRECKIMWAAAVASELGEPCWRPRWRQETKWNQPGCRWGRGGLPVPVPSPAAVLWGSW